MFSSEGRARGPYPVSLPTYAEEDPRKIDYPPPPYLTTSEDIPNVICRQESRDALDTRPLITSNVEES